jgi:threonine dehydratase
VASPAPHSILPTPDQVRSAALRIAPAVTRTTLVQSDTLSAYLGGDVFLKCECDQVTGSFKIRGATNVLAQVTAEQRAAGVVTASAGNHGAGTAAAGKALGITTTIFVPSSAPQVKRDRIAAFGATIDATAAHYDAADALAQQYARAHGATYVSPCTGVQLLAGQGTVALELLEQVPSVRTVVVSVGGGGLAGGVAGFLRAEAPHVRIIGAQSEHTNAMAKALASGHPEGDPGLPTLADGLAGLVDDVMLAQGRAALDTIVTASESAIADAIAMLWIEDGLKVEGAGAAGVAALLAGVCDPITFPLVVILSGGNIDDATHRALMGQPPPGPAHP